MKRKGVFIDDEILQDKALTLWERVIFAMLSNWHNTQLGKPISQKYICSRLAIDKGEMSKHIKNLKGKGYIENPKKGVYIPASKVGKTPTNEPIESWENPNYELGKPQLKVGKTPTTHLIYNKKNKKSIKGENKKEIEKEKETFYLTAEKLEKEPPLSARPPLSDLPLWQQAAAAFVAFYEANEGQREVLYGMTPVKGLDSLKSIILECCSYYCDQDYKMKQVIENPARMSGLITRWAGNSKKFQKPAFKSKQGGTDLTDDFLTKLNEYELWKTN